MRAQGRLTLVGGPDIWDAQVASDGLRVHVQGEDVLLQIDWTRPADAAHGHSEGTCVVRIPQRQWRAAAAAVRPVAGR